MSDRDERANAREAGEAGSGTVPGDVIGTGGVTGGTGARKITGGAPPRSEALGSYGTGARATPRDETTDEVEAEERETEGAMGDTVREHSVVPEAEWGITSGAPSGGTSGGVPGQEVERRTRD